MRISSTIVATVAVLLWSLHSVSAAATADPDPAIVFRQGSEILYPDYRSNRSGLDRLESEVTRYEDIILSGNGHIRLVACIAPADKDNPAAINMAATRAVVLRTHLCRKFRMLTKWCFTFYIDVDAAQGNSVRVGVVHGRVADDAPGDIYFSTRKDDPAAIRQMLSKYGKLPFIDEVARQPHQNAGAPASFPPVVSLPADDGKTTVAIYYRWDKSKIDSLYLSNPHNLRTLDSLLTSADTRRIDTLTIVAYASPEGDSIYNRRLSERRATTIRDNIVERYRGIDPVRITTSAQGENWEGMAKLVADDQNLPSRDKVLEILRSPMAERQKQSALTRLDGGKTYYRYILPNYYTYLRLGATVMMSYMPVEPVTEPEPEPIAEPEPPVVAPPVIIPPVTVPPGPEPESVPTPALPQLQTAKYPLALKTNMLYDLAGAANLGVELPIGSRWSVVGDAAYAYWRTSNHLYALQTLEYGLSGRYWLPVGERRKERNPEWDKPLRGWNFGVYGRYWQRYDVQWIDGVQGDGSWSAGITAGYAFPVARNLSLETGLGAGYLHTSEYRSYDRPVYDEDGNYHLMWKKTAIWSGLTLTRVSFSLVWLIETGKGEGK